MFNISCIHLPTNTKDNSNNHYATTCCCTECTDIPFVFVESTFKAITTTQHKHE